MQPWFRMSATHSPSRQVQRLSGCATCNSAHAAITRHMLQLLSVQQLSRPCVSVSEPREPPLRGMFDQSEVVVAASACTAKFCISKPACRRGRRKRGRCASGCHRPHERGRLCGWPRSRGWCSIHTAIGIPSVPHRHVWVLRHTAPPPWRHWAIHTACSVQ